MPVPTPNHTHQNVQAIGLRMGMEAVMIKADSEAACAAFEEWKAFEETLGTTSRPDQVNG